MKKQLIPFFKKEGNKIFFIGEELKIYVPNQYIESGLAEPIGERYNIFGILEVEVSTGKLNNIRGTLNIPTFNIFYPSKTEFVTENGEKILVLTFFKNDPVMDKATRSDMENAKLFLQMLCAGKLPTSIPYNKALDVWDKNLNSNNMNYQVPSTIKEIIIAELYRLSSDHTKKVASVLGKNPSTEIIGKYEGIGINEICASNTFTAITFENMDEMIISSIVLNKTDQDEKESPLEKIIKM